MVSSLSPAMRDRYPSLDGLRGVAALVVLVHHTSMILPSMAAAYTGARMPETWSATWWFSFTPLRLLTAGSEAVIVFFVLSGFVLTLPVLRRGVFDWIGYYPRRVIRIGIPSAVSVLLAFALMSLVPQIPHEGINPWLANLSTHPVDWKMLLRALDPLSGERRINGPLWSIYWEMVFSMTLPLFVGLVMLARRKLILLVVGATLVGFIGIHTNSEGFQYLPAFLVGCAAAAGLDRIRAVGEKISAQRFAHLAWAAILVASCLTLILRWLVPPLPSAAAFAVNAMNALWPIAALGIVFCSFQWAPLVKLLSTGPFRWAGLISFSLYLVHEPILFSFRYALDALPLPLILALAVLTALAVATIFYLLVEKRAHQFSRYIGGKVSEAVKTNLPHSHTPPPHFEPARADEPVERASV